MMNRSDVTALFNQLPEFLSRVQPRMDDWMTKQFQGEAADGEIVATVDPAGQLKSLEIGLLAKRRLDNLTLGEEITAAIRNAVKEANDHRWDMLEGLQVGDLNLRDLMRDGPAAMAKRLLGQSD
ncbi:MAG TPA: YbaB/EbfC family nucleoid-associated protein [Actinopolymorphaceae bacterium]